jgi:hypothetical protein
MLVNTYGCSIDEVTEVSTYEGANDAVTAFTDQLEVPNKDPVNP